MCNHGFVDETIHSPESLKSYKDDYLNSEIEIERLMKFDIDKDFTRKQFLLNKKKVKLKLRSELK